MKSVIANPIQNEQVRLRLLRETDLPMTLTWRNQDQIRRWFVHSEVIAPDQHEKWFRQYSDREDDYVFVIELRGPVDVPVGQVALYRIDPATRSAEFGRLMIGDPQAQGKGIARQATLLTLEFGFQYLGLERIYLEVFKDNAPARHIYQNAGFIQTHEENNLVAMEILKHQFSQPMR